jgi:3',5'-cyclic AMP phosphodiesterase CpdA
MRFAAITDIHFGHAEPYRGTRRKLTEHAPDLTGEFVRQRNDTVHPDFVVVLGDLIEDQDHDTDRACYQQAISPVAKLDMPVRHIYGNHDTVNLSLAELVELSREPALNSSFDVDGWHFVRLHSTSTKVPSGDHSTWSI